MHEHVTWDDLPDPGEDDRIIDYWVWRRDRLVPAAPDDIVHIDDIVRVEEERQARALHRPGHFRIRDLRKARRMRRRLPFMGCPPLVTPWLLAKRSRRRVAHEEEAHAEQSITG